MLYRSRALLLIIVILLIGTGVYAMNRYYHRLTDGFSIEGISSELHHTPAWEMPPLATAQQQLVEQLLNKPFHYLAKGTQSFVFVSEDGQYVIKFFKQMHLRMPWYRHYLTSIPFASRYINRKMERRESKREKIYGGCKLAYEQMQEDTGVLYVHLNPSDHLPRELTLFDKLGRKSVIDPNGIAFYLQKKGTPLYRMFQDYHTCQDLEGAKHALDRLFAYLLDRSRRGILDRDPAYAQNLGFIGEHAGNLDVGNLTTDPLIKNPVEYRRRIQEHLIDFRMWLALYYQELLPFYDAHIRALNDLASTHSKETGLLDLNIPIASAHRP